MLVNICIHMHPARNKEKKFGRLPVNDCVMICCVKPTHTHLEGLHLCGALHCLHTLTVSVGGTSSV